MEQKRRDRVHVDPRAGKITFEKWSERFFAGAFHKRATTMARQDREREAPHSGDRQAPTLEPHVERAGAPRRRNLLTHRLDEARHLYDKGWSLATIGQHLGVNATAVWHALRKAKCRCETHTAARPHRFAARARHRVLPVRLRSRTPPSRRSWAPGARCSGTRKVGRYSARSALGPATRERDSRVLVCGARLEFGGTVWLG